MANQTLAEAAFERSQREWLAQQFESLPFEFDELTPSEWAERKRYLPPSATSLPGYYRFSVTPYLREIIDCLSPDSPVRFVALMKGAQVGATTVLENGLGYLIDHVKTAPVMWVTADAELAKHRLETYIVPMIQDSGLGHLIKSADIRNHRKTGQTDKKIEWEGGGFLLPFGAVNANKLRSFPIQVMIRDEVDGWPRLVGRDGDPMKLTESRTVAYESTRKVFDISTPLLANDSNIAKRFRLGDQRYYFVRCLSCGYPQRLRFRREDPATGVVSGIVWETQNDVLVPDSVRYLCENCGHEHFNDDKTRLLSPEHGAEWRPTAQPATPAHRSYHLSALYAPVGMQTWASCVGMWLEAWDVAGNRPRDMGALQVFYNNVLGEPFELRGEKLRFEQVSPHRRREYKFGEIPNAFARQYAASPILVVTAAVDVHADNLAVAVFGWARDRRAFLLDYDRFTGRTDELDNPDTWGRLRKLVEEKVYAAGDGLVYRPVLTLVDSGYRADDVYRFCSEYSAGVAAVKGESSVNIAASGRLFHEFKPPLGQRAFGISVDHYKDRWSAALRRSWDGMGMQPAGHFNAPLDATDDQLKELTRETKVEKIDPRTKQRVGWEWHRPSGAKNELWDCLIYASAALDMLAWDYCRLQLELDQVNWAMFWDFCEGGAFFMRSN